MRKNITKVWIQIKSEWLYKYTVRKPIGVKANRPLANRCMDLYGGRFPCGGGPIWPITPTPVNRHTGRQTWPKTLPSPQTTHVCGQQNALGVHPCGIPSFSLYFITNEKPNVIKDMTSLCTCYSDLCLWVLINLKFRWFDFMSLVTFIWNTPCSPVL